MTASKSDRLRIGLIGAGMISEFHLIAWRSAPGAHVVAIADPVEAHAADRAGRFGIEAKYGDAARLIKECQLDAVDIATPVQTHGDLCRLAAEHGVAILCQKPLAQSHAEGRSIVDGVAGRVRFMVHENWRFRSHYRRVHEWLKSGTIGDVRQIEFDVASRGLVPDATGRYPALQRQAFLKDMPRLLVFEVLIHHLDVLRYLFGDLTVLRAELHRNTGVVLGEDAARIELVSAQGVPIVLTGNLAAAGAPAHIRDRLVIEGRAGRIEVQDAERTLHAIETVSETVPVPELYQSAFSGAVESFVQCLRSGAPFETEAGDNLKTLKLVEDVYAAA